MCRNSYRAETPSRAGTFVGVIKNIYQRYHRWLMIKATCRKLKEMDDRMLKDIGISRADVGRLTTDYGFWSYMAQPDKAGPKSRA